MSEKLISSDELKNYLKTVDTSTEANKRVLAGLQTLHARYMEEILFYLVKGIIVISDLYNKDINNFSAKVIIQNVEASSNTLRNHVYYYRNFVYSSIPYKAYMTEKKLITPSMLSRKLITNEGLQVRYATDEFGNERNTFNTDAEVMAIYDTLSVMDTDIQAKSSELYNLAANISESIPSFAKFSSDLIAQILAYKLIRSENGSLRKEIGADTIVGFIMREQYGDLRFTDIIENHGTITMVMAENYEEDGNGTGVGLVGLNKMLADDNYSYENAFSYSFANREDIFLELLLRAVAVHKVFFSEIYIDYYPTKETEAQVILFNKIVDYMATVRSFCLLYIEKLKVEIDNYLLERWGA